MKYSRFEELPVRQDAIELAVRVFELTAATGFQALPRACEISLSGLRCRSQTTSRKALKEEPH